MPKKTEKQATEIQITKVNVGQLMFRVVGHSPIIMNRMAEKARQELLLPRGRKTAADKAANLKHNPIEEYRNSVYKRKEDGPTRLLFPSVAFKRAVASAAIDSPGMKKAQVGRLTWVDDLMVDIYGIPQLKMDVVRSSDMNKTPDIRTRAILPNWACTITLTYVKPLLQSVQIANLMSMAGLIIGLGDGRPEKGTFSFGQFDIVDEDDENFLSIIKNGGIIAQDKALEDPVMFDVETEDLYDWFTEEVVKRRDNQPRRLEKVV